VSQDNVFWAEKSLENKHNQEKNPLSVTKQKRERGVWGLKKNVETDSRQFEFSHEYTLVVVEQAWVPRGNAG
jgi:hypothetical protein